MHDFSKYENLNEYMQLRLNKLEKLPTTKRHMYSLLMSKMEVGTIKAVIGGLGRVGKTTILKQIAESYGDDALYISFSGMNQEVNKSFSLIDELLEYIEEVKLKVILVDEVTHLYDYNGLVGELLNRVSLKPTSIIIAASAKYYLRKMAYGVGGCRCDYVELYPVSFYEYLSILDKYDIFDQIYVQNEENIYNSLYNYDFFTKLNDSNVEELFFKYLEYVSSTFYDVSIESYIEGCYNDYIDSEIGINEEFSSGTVNLETAKKLLYVTQAGIIKQFSAKDVSRLFEEYSMQLKQVDRSELVESAMFLFKWGLIYPVIEKTDDISINEASRIASWAFSGTEVNLKDIYQNMNFTDDIFLYISLLKRLGIRYDSCNSRELLVEHYCMTQTRKVSKSNCSMRLSVPSIHNASEIDILSPEMRALIEIGIGDKTSSKLAFADLMFNEKYPEYRDYKRIYVSRRNKQLNSEYGYLEVPFWYFGLTADATVLGEVYRKITATKHE